MNHSFSVKEVTLSPDHPTFRNLHSWKVVDTMSWLDKEKKQNFKKYFLPTMYNSAEAAQVVADKMNTRGY